MDGFTGKRYFITEQEGLLNILLTKGIHKRYNLMDFHSQMKDRYVDNWQGANLPTAL